VLHLRHGGDQRAVHLLIRAGDTGATVGPDSAGDSRATVGPDRGGAVGPDRGGSGQLVGYAHVDTTDPVEGASAELCIHPMYRRRGLGRALLTEAMAVARGTGQLRLWAHGDHPSATVLALSLGFERWRVLWQLRRSLYAPVPAPQLPPGVRLRQFRPGEDDEAWLALNAEAFTHLPDQGGWTRKDLQLRLSEPWYDPEGFLLAERSPGSAPTAPGSAPAAAGSATGGAGGAGGELLGFHWTKVHGAPHAHPSSVGTATHAHDPIGEVYVLGISPAARGTGLGTALTLAGLRHLRARGLDQVMLYVDEANPRAISLYQQLGFANWSTDVCFRRAG